MKSALILLLIISFPLNVLGQNKKFKVSGKILDSISLEELPFANIQIVGTNRGVTTDDKGDFSISDIEQSTQLLVSYVGYRSLQINLNESDITSRLFIKLQPINIHLQEVTVYSNSALKADQIQSSNLSIQSERIREIAAGQEGMLKLAASPTEQMLLKVVNVTGLSDGDNEPGTFRVEARLVDAPAMLRPGMRGVAKVEVGKRRRIWIWTHELFDWMRYQLWAWLP